MQIRSSTSIAAGLTTQSSCDRSMFVKRPLLEIIVPCSPMPSSSRLTLASTMGLLFE